MAAISKVTE